MRTFTILFALGVLLSMGGCEASQAPPAQAEDSSASKQNEAADVQDPLAGKLVDLSHSFDEQTIYWPTEKGFVLEREKAGYTDKGYYYAANRFKAAEHGGTHIDAPIHFAEDHKTVDEIPLERLVGPAVVVDVSQKCVDDPDYQITIDDLRHWEESQGETLGGKIVLLRTGWGKFWPDRLKYLGTTELGEEAVPKLHFPGLHPEAAQWLAEHRNPKLVGLDTPSIDYGQSQLFGSHVNLFKNNVPALENVANLDQLPVSGFTVIALPMKIRGGSGGPTRIMAIVPE